MKSFVYFLMLGSIALNAIAARMFYKNWRQTYLAQERVRTLSAQLGDVLPECGYHVVYTEDNFTLSRDDRGSYLFMSKLFDEPVSLSFDNCVGKSELDGRRRCMVSSRNFFASWHIALDKCDHVVFQYNDLERKDDLNGDGNIISSNADKNLFFAENGFKNAE